MYIDSFEINELDMKMGASFAGCVYEKMNSELKELLNKAGSEILKVSKPKVVFEIFEINQICEAEGWVSFKNIDFKLLGRSICTHLKESQKAVFMAATLGNDTDKIIRKASIAGLEYAVFLDGMAGVMIETVCDETEVFIKETYKPVEMTFRFGLGYGDLPLEQEADFLRLLNAGALLGLCVTDSNLLVPCKSVACIIGLKD